MPVLKPLKNKIRQQSFLLSAWHPWVIILAVVFLVYAKTLGFGFVDYDDRRLIVENQAFLSDISNVILVFQQDVFDVQFYNSSHSYYRPLLTLSLMLDAQFGGQQPLVYHLSNLLIHSLASCLVFAFFCRLSFKRELALLFALLFAVHPALTQAVAWIGGRNDSLLTICFLGSFIFFLGFVERMDWKSYAAHLLFLFLALLAKETGIVALALCCLYLVIQATSKPLKSLLMYLVPGWLAVTGLWLLLRTLAVENPGVTLEHVIRSVAVNSPGIIQYVGKALIPWNLSVYPVMKDLPLVYGAVACLVTAVLLLVSRPERPGMVVFGLAWFILNLMPTLVSANPGPSTLFLEHRLYLPMIGLMLVLMEMGFIRKLDLGKILPLSAAGMLVLVFSVLTFFHSSAMKDPLSYWANAATTSPGSEIAHLNLGDKYFALKKLDQAEAEFKEALAIAPDQPRVHNNVGLVHAVRGEFQKAEAEFMTALAINPGFEQTLYNLGMLNYDQGKITAAINFWEQTLVANPYNIRANRYLAYYYYNAGEFAKAGVNVSRLQERGIAVDRNYFKELFAK